MIVKEFTYTKTNGSVSTRTLIELITPTAYIEGVDVSELSDEVFAEFTKAFKALEAEMYTQRTELYAKFDLSKNYRCFIPERMSKITSEHI